MEQQQVNIAIKKIKDVEFSIIEDFTYDNPEDIGLRFDVKSIVLLEQETVELLLTASFVYTPNDSVFMKIKTSNVFTIMELAKFQGKDSETYTLPDNVVITMLSLSISHTRALLAKNALGTKFADLYLPIVNPTELSKQLFGIK